jgi:subtilase family serine protease
MPASERSVRQASVPANTPASFDLSLTLSDPAGAAALVRQVSDPASASYRHYLTLAQWVSRFGPTAANISAAENWLQGEGFTVGALAPDHLYIQASGTVGQMENAFSTTFSYYQVNGATLRQADSALSIPASISGAVSGVVGANQVAAQTSSVREPEPPPPAGFRNPQPCGAFWAQKSDLKDSGALYAPYTYPLPYDICGYVPGQLRSAYGISSNISRVNGTGVTIGIVDAYDSPTILSDVQTYFALNDPSHPFQPSQFTNLAPSTTDQYANCQGGGTWFGEQSLDIESSHAMAPGANILYVGAVDCYNNNLLNAFTTAATSGASVVSDSWGDTLGDLFDDVATRTAYDNAFEMADATGVSVLFSSGDDGDNFAISGLTAPDYPPSSPYVTAVGGTSLEINSTGQRWNEYGWSTANSVLCGPVATTNCGTATTPETPLTYDYGGGGGTSFQYPEPYYQANVVPFDLAARNAKVTGILNRVEPDISMDADPQTGFLVGLTQTFPNGTYYDQYKIGGTSLASPLLAGIIADTDQVAGVSLGFLNPTLYKAYTEYATAFKDILPPSDPNKAATVRVDYADSVDSSDGYVIKLRVLDYQGVEQYCDLTGSCTTRDVALTVTPGFDAMTGLGVPSTDFISRISKF